MVKEDDEFAHDGDEGEFLGFAVGHETVVNRFEDRVVTGGHERGHVEHSPHLLAASVNGAASLVRAAVVVVGREAAQRGSFTAAGPSRRGRAKPKGSCVHN